VRSSFIAACRALRPAALSLEIIVSFCPGKPVAALRSLALRKGFYQLQLLVQHPELGWKCAITQFSYAFQLADPPVFPQPFPCSGHGNSIEIAGSADRQTSLLSKNDDSYTNTPVMVSHHDENEERVALTSADI